MHVDVRSVVGQEFGRHIQLRPGRASAEINLSTPTKGIGTAARGTVSVGGIKR